MLSVQSKELSLHILGDGKDSSQSDVPPKKLLKAEAREVSYADSIDCAKFPCPPFYLTKVTGIADTHNSPDVAIGIKGDHYFVYIQTYKWLK